MQEINMKVYYETFLKSVEKLTISFFKFLGTMSREMVFFDDSKNVEIFQSVSRGRGMYEFYTPLVSLQYISNKNDLEADIENFLEIINTDMYGLIRTKTLLPEFGFGYYRIISAEQRIFYMIEGFHKIYSHYATTIDRMAFMGLSYLESLVNTLSITLTKIAENYPVPNLNLNKSENQYEDLFPNKLDQEEEKEILDGINNELMDSLEGLTDEEIREHVKKFSNTIDGLNNLLKDE